jgi:hypothetical protein
MAYWALAAWHRGTEYFGRLWRSFVGLVKIERSTEFGSCRVAIEFLFSLTKLFPAPGYAVIGFDGLAPEDNTCSSRATVIKLHSPMVVFLPMISPVL